MTLSTLLAVPIGGSAVIDSLDVTGPVRRRLLDLGLTPGTKIKCLYEAPSGDPKAYLVRNTVIALRKTDASTVFLQCKTNKS
jgi:ferrous iron transport protein A